MATYLNIVQIILGIALIVLVLFEVRSSGLGGVFGGTETTLIRKRRGVELLIFRLTIVTAVIFCIVSVINVLLAQ